MWLSTMSKRPQRCHHHRVTAVLVVDDHPAFRSSVRALLEADGFAVVGEAASGAEALEKAARLEPDVVLLDIRLPDIDGFTVARRLSGLLKTPAVILVSSRSARTYGTRLSSSPARGFLTKEELTGASLRVLLR